MKYDNLLLIGMIGEFFEILKADENENLLLEIDLEDVN